MASGTRCTLLPASISRRPTVCADICNRLPSAGADLSSIKPNSAPGTSSWYASTAFLVAALVTFALFLNREGAKVPSGNENIYLLYMARAWNPPLLQQDWTFQESTAGHAVFNFLFGWPTRFASIEQVAWVGRFLVWTLSLWGLMRIGSSLRIPRLLVFAGILLWVIQRQSFVSGEWIIGTFEAKCTAYVCLIWSIDLALRGRWIVSAVLTGLAFSLHSAVGLWGGGAVAIAFAATHPMKKTLIFAAWAAAFATPGLVTSLRLALGPHPITEAEARFLALSEMPFHLDPFSFGWAKTAVLFLMLAFNVIHAWRNRHDMALRFLGWFGGAGGGFFLFGIAFRMAGAFSLLKLFPFRVCAVVTMLFFFWHLVAAYNQRRQRSQAALLCFGVFMFLCLPSPMLRLQSLAADQWPKWRRGDDDFRVAAKWVREHTAESAVVIAPPWRKDGFYSARRPLIANWHAPRFDAMTEWRQRIQSLAGDVSNMSSADNLAGEMDERARFFYAHLSERDLSAIREKYGGDILISSSPYAYPILFSTPTYRVYRLVP